MHFNNKTSDAAIFSLGKAEDDVRYRPKKRDAERCPSLFLSFCLTMAVGCVSIIVPRGANVGLPWWTVFFGSGGCKQGDNMKKKILSAVLAVALILTYGMSLASCKTDEPTPTPEPTGPATYTVTVTTEYGLPLSGLSIIIHDEASPSPNSSVARLTTNLDGQASVELDTAAVYSVKILYAEDGFLPEEKYLFNSDRHADVKVKTAPIDDIPARLDAYMLGSVVHNFTLYDINGVEYRVSDVLEENKLLILNFWFTTCGPCASEFPAIISAYEKYKNSGVEIFAINDYGDTVSAISGYRVNYGGQSTALPFPTFKGDSAANGFGKGQLIRAFDGSSYPHTVFIDRSGMICYIHRGTIPEVTLERLIEHFIADEYTQRLGTNIFN